MQSGQLFTYNMIIEMFPTLGSQKYLILYHSPHKRLAVESRAHVAHPYAIFLCSLGESLVGHLTSTHAKSRKMSIHKMSLQPLIYQTLPKAQRTRGLSAADQSNKFLRKS